MIKQIFTIAAMAAWAGGAVAMPQDTVPPPTFAAALALAMAGACVSEYGLAAAIACGRLPGRCQWPMTENSPLTVAGAAPELALGLRAAPDSLAPLGQ